MGYRTGMTNTAAQVHAPIRRTLALVAIALASMLVVSACGVGGRDWFGNDPATPQPACNLAGLPDPADVHIPSAPLLPNGQPKPPAGGQYTLMEVALLTRVLDADFVHCSEPTPLGGLWDVGYNVTSDGLPFPGTAPNPFNGTTTDPHIWAFYVIHGQPDQIPPIVSVDFHAKYRDGLGQVAMPKSGAGAACIVRVGGTVVATSIAYPMVGSDYLHCAIVVPASYFP